jgi:methyltransferase (TIGR00027 family)
VLDARPSATARRVALRRAAHQILDAPLVFEDPLALAIVGAGRPATDIFRGEDTRLGRAMRAFMAARSRFAEDELASAVARGVRQYVVLGAGLDTFAYRNPFGPSLRVFEVDYPATQAWKRAQLEAAGIRIPSSVTYTPVDFERGATFAALIESGFDAGAPAFFAWLGVTMYVAEDAVMAMLRRIAAMPPAGGVVFDYAVGPWLLGPVEQMVFRALADRVAAVGEPWTTFFEPQTLATSLRRMGFARVLDLGVSDINDRYFYGRRDGLRVGTLARLIGAFTSAECPPLTRDR